MLENSFVENHVLIKVLRQEKGHGAKNIAEFPNTPWTLKQVVLLQKIDADGTIERKYGNGWKRTVSKYEEFIDEAVKQWRRRLRACIRAH